MLRSKRVIIPALLIALVVSTLVFGYHTEYGSSLVSQSRFSKGTAKNRTLSSNIWTLDEIPKHPKSPLNDPHDRITTPQGQFQPLKDRIRYEASEVWRKEGNMVPQDHGSQGFARLKAPSREEYTSEGQFLRQSIPGYFNYGADKAFIMYKTGSDTMWKRMPPHFLTDLTKAWNFAIYSDCPGSMFGHEVIDILKTLPQSMIDSKQELKRYKAMLQSHDEHWNWAPEYVKGDGGWACDRYKNIPIAYDAYLKNPNCDWYVLIDDDSYIFYDNMIKWLDTMDPNEMIYTGSTAGISFRDEGFYFAHGGSVVVTSRAVIDALFAPDERRKVKKPLNEFFDEYAEVGSEICCGDALWAYMLRHELNVDLYVHPLFKQLLARGGPFQGETLESLYIPDNAFCNPVVSWHHVNSHHIEMLWEYERLWKEDRFITYDDIYRDFYLPYIVEEKPNWLIPTGTENYPQNNRSPQDIITYEDKEYRPAASKDQCKELCVARHDCAAWSYREGECRVTNEGFIFGRAANRWNKEEGWTSGFLVDRIRQQRANSSCDPLERDANGNYNDDESTSEGWMIRKMLRDEAQHPNNDPRDSVFTVPAN